MHAFFALLEMGELAALGTAFLWAFSGLLLRPVARVLPAVRITALQYLVAATVFLAIGVGTGRLLDLSALPPTTALGLVFTAVFGLAAGDTAYLRSLSYLGLARGFTISTAGYFVITVGVSALVLREPVTLQHGIGAVVMLGGIRLLSRSGGSAADQPPDASVGRAGVTLATSLRVGLAFAGMAALCWGLNTVALRVLLEGVDLLVAIPLRLTAAAIALNAMSQLRYGPLWKGNEGPATARIVGAGLLGLGVGSVLYLYAIQTAGAAKTAILSSASPLFATVLAIVFLREALNRSLVLGTLLVVVGMVLVASA